MTNYRKSTSKGILQQRQQGIVMVEVDMSNPNGNASDGRPRQLPDDHGVIHPVCFKSKIRKMIRDKDSLEFLCTMERLGIPESDFDRFRILESKCRGFGHDVSATDAVKKLSKLSDAEITEHYWDHRMFGSTQLEGKESEKGQEGKLNFKRTGCVTMTGLVSVAPIHIIDDQIVKSFPPAKDKTDANNGTFGATSIVQHGLYVGRYTYNPLFAENVTEDDLKLFKFLLVESFGLSQAASRSSAYVARVIHVTHGDCIGNERQFQKFYDLMMPVVKEGVVTPNGFNDYEMPSIEKAKSVFTNAVVEELA